MEAAATKAGRSLAQEAEFRLERAFDPIAERLCEISVSNNKSSQIIRALAAVFGAVSFEEEGFPTYLSRAALLSAFQVILEEHFRKPGGLMADLFVSEDPQLRAKVEKRFAMLAEQIVTAQRVALYGEGEADPGLTMLQTAQVLGLIPSDGREAAKTLDGAARAVKQKKIVSAG
ncbi:hypothetical protein [Methylobacterium sp. WL12]|uniref:hypothetical protein n=1 Tax=Methylobacterium sp. WL12 TaxID=2603890 RepID=UPI0011CAE858|nr:hypothetical protein [Methylobacterium sp. WL12]